MNRRVLSFLLAVLMVFGLFPVSARAEEPEQPVTITVVAEEDYDDIVDCLEEINDFRAYRELPPLSLNATLTEAAMLRASEIGLFYDDKGTRPDGTSVWELDCFASGDWTDLAEFVDHSGSSQSVYISLVNDERFAPIISSGDYTQIGIGRVNGRWAVIVGKNDTDTAPVTATGRQFRYRTLSVFPSLLHPDTGGHWLVYLWANDSTSFSVYSRNQERIDLTYIVPIFPDVVLDRKGDVIATVGLTDTEYGKGLLEITWVKPGSGSFVVYLDEEKTVSTSIEVNCFDEDGNLPTPVPDPNNQDSGTWGENITWTLEGTTLTIAGEGVMEPEVYSESTYPWTYYRDAVVDLVVEEGVTEIAVRAFTYFSQLEQISLPESLTTIGESAFQVCPKLKSAQLPDSVTTIGSRAFDGCSSLESIRLPKNLTYIPGYLLSGTAISEIEIPESVVGMGEGVFMSCTKLESVILPEAMLSVSDRCFESCTALKSVTLPDRMLSLGFSSFSGCTSLATIALPNSLEYIGTYCFNGSGLESITLPESVNTIRDYAFAHCQNLVMVTVPDGWNEPNAYILEGSPNAVLACHFLTRAHVMAIMNDIPVEILPEDPTTPVYPVTVYTNEGGTVNLSGEYSPAGRYVMIQIVPDENHLFASMYYYRTDGVEEELEVLQLSELEYLIMMSPCELVLDTSFLVSAVPFTDVTMDAYYYVPVLWAVSYNITAGTGPETFTPDAPCTRAQVVTFLWRAAGEPEPEGVENPFEDVKEGDYFYKAVLWAVDNGITAGTSATQFSPNAGCTRGQVVTFLWRACGKPEYNHSNMGFADVPSDAYYHDAVRWAADYQITSGVNETHFSPDTICTRGQIVTFLFRTFF